MHIQMMNRSGEIIDYDNVILLVTGYLPDRGKPRKAWRICFPDRSDVYLPMRENSIVSVDTQIPIDA